MIYGQKLLINTDEDFRSFRFPKPFHYIKLKFDGILLKNKCKILRNKGKMEYTAHIGLIFMHHDIWTNH